jgi:hypothetical protein
VALGEKDSCNGTHCGASASINHHLQEIYKSNELNEMATIRKFRIVQPEGARQVSREVEFCNLDAIIAVGYRVNSRQATQFRIWATQVLREFLVKGFVLDDERLKQGQRFGKDWSLLAVHPRVRGEHCSGAVGARWQHGSSPRSRGTLG